MVEIQGTMIDLEAPLTGILGKPVKIEAKLINRNGREVENQGTEVDRKAGAIRVEGTVVDWMATPTKLFSATEPHNVPAVRPDRTALRHHAVPGVALWAFVTAP